MIAAFLYLFENNTHTMEIKYTTYLIEVNNKICNNVTFCDNN